MTAIKPHTNVESNPVLQKQPNEIAKFILESRYIFNGWLAALILLLLTLIFNPYLNEVKYVITTAILFIYLWVMLLARLDQLATSIGIKSSAVYKTLFFPVIGTIVCYRNIMRIAINHSNSQ